MRIGSFTRLLGLELAFGLFLAIGPGPALAQTGAPAAGAAGAGAWRAGCQRDACGVRRKTAAGRAGRFLGGDPRTPVPSGRLCERERGMGKWF